MTSYSSNQLKRNGFTLIEVLVVIVVVGLMAAAIQFSFNSNKSESELQQESVRFAGIFDLAAQYGLLNNIELGLVLDKSSYHFVGYNGTQWVELDDIAALGLYQLPDQMTLTIVYDDLVPEASSLISRELFIPDDEDDFTLDNEEEKPIIPQVYILSGGDITPFKLTFGWEITNGLDEEITYDVIGKYTTPLTVQGPVIDGVYYEPE
ncbi:type II secretion system minor pseudopilin GspH [Thalassotalea piscium]|uniref:Type II secretion system protein H n=1 Tax=Thalassotalea piscium TaxID=1230533 RepID=A0A7X0NHI0_9GAMM|nr:type II secretion system minor pseudopilin GspH [Thalassotalea piscium]MBB6543473.1 general secretion pathway protein H [Thalassotalea piscium]